MPLMLTIEELHRGACRWPAAEFEKNVLLYCGAPVDPSPSPTMRCYCAAHALLAYRHDRVPVAARTPPPPPPFAGEGSTRVE
jgi:hypothetical protein